MASSHIFRFRPCKLNLKWCWGIQYNEKKRFRRCHEKHGFKNCENNIELRYRQKCKILGKNNLNWAKNQAIRRNNEDA